MTRKGSNILVMALWALLAAAPAAADSYGTELPFTAGTGGRASGLGLAATSMIGGPSLQHFNPASLSLKRNQSTYRANSNLKTSC